MTAELETQNPTITNNHSATDIKKDKELQTKMKTISFRKETQQNQPKFLDWNQTI